MTINIKVDVWHGPIGGYGFRKGWWTVDVDGKPYKMFASIPHNLDLDRQRELLLQEAKCRIAQGPSQIFKAV